MRSVTEVLLMTACAALGASCGSFNASPPDPSADAGAMGSDGAADAVDGAVADAGAGRPCRGALACERVVFVTSQTHSGIVGGQKNANGKCNASAAASSLPRLAGRTFTAWISDGTSSAKDRVINGTGRYVTVTGDPIADDFAALLNGGVQRPPADENGVEVGGAAWTGTRPDGTVSTETCNGWLTASSAVRGDVGKVGATGSDWTLSNMQTCGTGARLYCFED